MKQNIFRIVLTALAFVTLFAGSINVDRTNAAAAGPGLCNETCGCTPGPNLCCSQGSITCYGI